MMIKRVLVQLKASAITTSFLLNWLRSNPKKMCRKNLMMAPLRNLHPKNNNDKNIPSYVTQSMKKWKCLMNSWASRESNFLKLFLSKIIQKLDVKYLISFLSLSRENTVRLLSVLNIFSSWTWKIWFLQLRAHVNHHLRNHQWKKIWKTFLQWKILNSQAQWKETPWNCQPSASAQRKALSKWTPKKKTVRANRENRRRRLRMKKTRTIWNHQRKMERKLILSTCK